MPKQTILLIDHNPDDVVLTLRALKSSKLPHNVAVAVDGLEALDYLLRTGQYAQRAPGPPSLVLLDLKVPKLDGLEVLKRLRQEEATRMVPVVILTSSREESDVARAYSSGANSYIRKPADSGQFIEAVRQLGLYWLALNELPPTKKSGGDVAPSRSTDDLGTG